MPGKFSVEICARLDDFQGLSGFVIDSFCELVDFSLLDLLEL